MANESPVFISLKPLELATSNGKGGVHLDSKKCTQALRSHSASDRKGVYILTARGHGGRIMPWYVGRATKSFQQEVFTAHKIVKYNLALVQYACKNLQLQFIALPLSKGAPNVAAVKKLETFLISRCSQINDDLLNKQGTKQYLLRIAGVMNSKQGKPSDVAKALRSMLD